MHEDAIKTLIITVDRKIIKGSNSYKSHSRTVTPNPERNRDITNLLSGLYKDVLPASRPFLVGFGKLISFSFA